MSHNDYYFKSIQYVGENDAYVTSIKDKLEYIRTHKDPIRKLYSIVILKRWAQKNFDVDNGTPQTITDQTIAKIKNDNVDTDRRGRFTIIPMNSKYILGALNDAEKINNDYENLSNKNEGIKIEYSDGKYYPSKQLYDILESYTVELVDPLPKLKPGKGYRDPLVSIYHPIFSPDAKTTKTRGGKNKTLRRIYKRNLLENNPCKKPLNIIHENNP